MLHDGIEFHNVAELVKVEGVDGLRLQRMPESVRAHVDEGTAGVMLSPANSEIRFRIKDGAESASICLSSECPATAYIYHGPFQGGKLELSKEPTDLIIKPHNRLGQLTPEQRSRFAFDPGLVRVCFGDAYPEPVTYCGHSDDVCPPRDSDTPDKVYLAYGSSITHGTDLSGSTLSYAAHAAWKLGYDLRNLGASGCCLCEKATADFIAEQESDLVTLEVSVNMLGRGFTTDEFRERAGYLIERVADSNPDRPVVCITIFPHFRDICEVVLDGAEAAEAETFRQVIRDIVNHSNRPNLRVIEGAELLKDIGGLSMDLIHPGARGMIQIGEELAQRLNAL